MANFILRHQYNLSGNPAFALAVALQNRYEWTMRIVSSTYPAKFEKAEKFELNDSSFSSCIVLEPIYDLFSNNLINAN